MYHGVSNSLENAYRLSDAKSRSISPENFTGEKGRGGMATEGTGAAAARELGRGFKISPSVCIPAGGTFTMADIKTPGVIQHIWLTLANRNWRNFILRIYWDGQETPSVECPAGDFFCMGWQQYTPVVSLPVCVNPGCAFNCYWPMPFGKSARITMENRNEEDAILYYQIDYAETDPGSDIGYFHVQFRRSNPLAYGQDHVILDGVRGKGQYIGTYIAWGVHNSGWWGEGEIKFFLDGDSAYPTICGTGTEDYFCGSYNFENQADHQYEVYCTPYAGLCQVIRPDGLYASQQRFGMYRWHLPDPVRFDTDLRVTIQALGWRSGGRYLPLQDDISSVAFWYQTLPAAPFPVLPDRNGLEVI